MPVQLTEKDMQLFNLLADFGIMRLDQARIVYGEVSRYHIRRIERLSASGYISRSRGYIRLTKKSEKLLDKLPLRIQKRRYKEQALTVDFFQKFTSFCPQWKFIPSIIPKRRGIIEIGSQINAVLMLEENVRYAVYIFPYVPRPTTVHFLINEMRQNKNAGLDRVLVFYSRPSAISAFGGRAPDGLREFCMLPIESGAEAFMLYRKLIYPQPHPVIREFFADAELTKRPFAHFEYAGGYVTLLFNGDLVMREYLEEYLKHVQPLEQKTCIVIAGQSDSIPAGVQKVSVELVKEALASGGNEIARPLA